MKKNITYYYDEDDAVPIKRKKKTASKKSEVPKADEQINFTPRKRSSTETFGRDSSTTSDKKTTAPVNTKTADKTPSATASVKVTEAKAATASVKDTEAKTATVSSKTPAEEVSKDPKAAVYAVKEVKKGSDSKTVSTPKKDISEIHSPAKNAKAESEVQRNRINEHKREVIEVAEIPYNREYGRPKTNTSSASVSTSSEKKEPIKKPAPTKNFGDTEEFEAVTTAKKKLNFKVSFIIYTVVLLILSAFALLYVRGLLIDYEASQPENIVQAKIEEMKKSFEKGKPGSAVSLAEVMDKFSPDEANLEKFMSDFLSSEITYKKVSDSSDPDFIAFDIFSDKYKMAHIAMRSEGKVAKLVIFTMDKWVIEEFKVTGYTMDVTLPSSLTVKNGDEVIEGVPTEDGRTATYSVSSLTMPEITFTDVLGNTKSYSDSGEYKFKEYIITIPSNYTLKGKDVIPLSAASLLDIDDYKYVSEYCTDMPKEATYNICIMSDEADLEVYDNTGAKVDVSELGNSFTLEGQKGSDAMPENITNAPDPLEIAKLWSLFMTDDLGGKTHGFYNMEKHLIADSYLRDVAWKWATGVDITFTSPHTLSKNPFTTAEVSNFVSYSDTCFSCDVLLEKPMHIKKANTVTDKIYSTFYFVYCDDTDDGRDNPHWAIADIQKIAE